MSMRVAQVTAAAAALALLASCTPSTPQYSVKYAERRIKLEGNGLRAVIIPDDTTQLVEIDVRYEVGSNEDPPGKAGLAHLAEHLMFMLRPDGPETPPLMDYIGQMSTFFNAYTIWDQTHYMTQVHKDYLDAVLKIEAMRLFYGCETISEDEFLREREVVRNEIRQRMGDQENQVYQVVHETVYPKGHPYGRLTGGDDQQLTSITLEDACKFIQEHYVPERATIVIAGNVDFDETVAMIQKWFGKLPGKKAAPRAKVEPIKLAKQRIEKELDIPRTQIWVAWALPPQYSKDGKYANFIAGSIGGQFARFSEEWEFATNAGAFVSGGPHAPVLLVTAELKNEGDVDEALEFIWKSARNAHRNYEAGMFDSVKATWTGSFIASLEQLGARTGTVADIVQFDPDARWESNEDLLMRQLKEIDSIDGEVIRSAAKRLLDPDQAVTLIIRAKSGAKGVQERAKVEFSGKTHEDKRGSLDIDPKEAYQPLKVSAEFDALEGAQRFRLGNGMRVVLLPYASMPIVSAQLVFNVGAAHEPPNRAGLASVAAGFLSEAVSVDQGRQEMYTVFGKLGIEWSGSAGDDYTVFRARGINLYLEPLIKGLERLIVTGEYSQRGIESWQKRQRDRFSRSGYKDDYEFNRQLYGAVFGTDHPYTTNGSATPKSIGAIGRDVVSEFKRKHYSAKNATLVVTGNFDPKQAESVIRSTFGDWSGGHEDKPMAVAHRPRQGPEYIGVLAQKQLPHMRVAIAYPAPAGIDDKAAARWVMQTMLNDRMGDLRHKLGSTYGVYARKTTAFGPSMYQMGGTVDGARAGESLKAMRDGVDSLRRGEDFEVTFVKARRTIVQQLIGQSTVSSQLAAQLAQIELFGLPPDHYSQLLQKVAAVTPDQVKALIAEELKPELEVVVCIADRETLESAFTEAGLNEVKYVEPNYD